MNPVAASPDTDVLMMGSTLCNKGRRICLKVEYGIKAEICAGAVRPVQMTSPFRASESGKSQHVPCYQPLLRRFAHYTIRMSNRSATCTGS